MVIVTSKLTASDGAIGAGIVVAVQPQRIRVITARHVADHGPASIWIVGRRLPAEIVNTFADRDLAVLDAVGEHLKRLPIPAAVAPAPHAIARGNAESPRSSASLSTNRSSASSTGRPRCPPAGKRPVRDYCRS